MLIITQEPKKVKYEHPYPTGSLLNPGRGLVLMLHDV
jgi:hypothetical protein